MSTHLENYARDLRSSFDEERRARFDAEMRRFDFAGQLLALRLDAGLTQQQLAVRTGISQADVSRYERGLGNPTRTTIEALAAGLGARLQLARDGAATPFQAESPDEPSTISAGTS